MTEPRCVICKQPLGDRPIRLRYEGQHYAFNSERCKRIFQENPDRWLDASGGVLEQPR
ncbi:MAG TPA: YHS domain-containing protein [Candidatus Limnocylindria bacterium]|jgi:YHS domain-containing protein